MSHYTFIVNPTSGRGNGRRSLPKLEQCLQEKGVSYELVLTERPLHASEIAYQAAQEGRDVVVAVGGDGTVNETINGLMRAKQEGADQTTMAVLPVGRGNDFAYGMGMSADLATDCAIIANGNRRAIDIGRVTGGLHPEGRYFGNSVGIGFDAVVGFEALKMAPLNGFVSYIAAALKTIFLYHQATLVDIQSNGQSVRQPALMVAVMNGQRQGGLFFMSPEAKNDDGLFDVCIAGAASRARIFTLLPHFIKGSQFGQPEISFKQTEQVTVTAVNGTLPAHADGETICTDGQTLKLEILPRQLQIICPPPTGNQS